MLKNIVKGFVEMMNAINEGAHGAHGLGARGDAEPCHVPGGFALMQTCVRNRGRPWRKLRLSLFSVILPHALDRNTLYIGTRRFSKWLIWYGF